MSTNYIRKIIIIGKSGNGKSSLGNSLLQLPGKPFATGCGFNCVTKCCQFEKSSSMAVVDTPGLFDTDRCLKISEQALKIIESLKLCKTPHAFLFAVKYGRFTEEELLVTDVLRIAFGDQCLKHAVIVVTHVPNDMTDREFERDCDLSRLANLLPDFYRRLARIDNTKPEDKHIQKIMKYVDDISQNGNLSFENPYLKCHEEVLAKTDILDKNDGVHDQVLTILNEIKTTVDTAVREENERRQREENERRQQEENERRRKEEQKSKYQRWAAAAGACASVLLISKKLAKP